MALYFKTKKDKNLYSKFVNLISIRQKISKIMTDIANRTISQYPDDFEILNDKDERLTKQLWLICNKKDWHMGKVISYVEYMLSKNQEV